MLNYIYTFLFIIISCTNTQQQQQNGIPPNQCPYFQYLNDGSKYFGIVTPPNTGNNIELHVHFSQQTPLPMNYPITKLLSIESSQPKKYRVDFPSPKEVPILTKITLNGQDICLSNNYPPGSTTFFLYHKFGPNQPQTSFGTQTFTQLLQPTQSITNDVASFIPFEGTSSKQYPNRLQPPSFQEVGEGASPIIYSNRLQSQPVQEVAQPFQQISQSDKKALQVTQGLLGSSTAGNLNQSALQYKQCGEETSIAGYVVGGDELARGQFPWLTAIYRKKDSSLLFLCGGSLVSPRTVVTAGHCIKRSNLSADRVLVQLGRHNLEDFSDENYVTKEIANLVVHPQYNPTLFPDADLAILQLQSSVEYTKYIRPICLWTESTDTNQIVGQPGVIAGWGADGTGRTSTSIPKKVNTNIVSDTECRNSSANYNSLLSPRTFCAGNRDGSGPCMGDSGSGLMIYRNDRWYLRGIVSAGQIKQTTCDLYNFVIFCDVAQHLQWVQSQMVS